MKNIKSVLIVDDEPLARQTLAQMLSDVGWQGTLHQSHDGDSAVLLANSKRPELIFLDIRMPGLSGIEILRQLTYQPDVIFTTAYEEYAVAAFELGALDYLLKPFGRQRFEKVFARVNRKEDDSRETSSSRAIESIGNPKTSRIFVRDGAKIIPIPLKQLERAEGADDHVAMHVGNKQYLVSLRLSQLEKQLQSHHFLRIHRSHLINLEHVVSIAPYDNLRMMVTMASGTHLVASREGSKLLRDLPL